MMSPEEVGRWLDDYAVDKAAEELMRRLTHAERKWHGWHIHTGTYGITCRLCKSEDAADG